MTLGDAGAKSFYAAEDLTCEINVIDDPFFFKGAIFPDDDTGFINGIRLLSGAGITDIGTLNGSNAVLEDFGITTVLIGFYGSHNGEFIDSLGFITHDPNCTSEVAGEEAVFAETEVPDIPVEDLPDEVQEAIEV